MYKLEVRSNEKVFLITMSGCVLKDEGQQYLIELSKRLRVFNTSEYCLVIDIQELKATTQDSVDKVKNCIELLITTPFKERYSILPKSSIAVLQVMRLVGSDMFNKIIPVKYYEEIFTYKNSNNHV